jgi:type IV pilus assembly protein PilB
MDKRELLKKLIEKGKIDEKKAEEIFNKSEEENKTILRVILDEKIMNEDEIIDFLKENTNYPVIDISSYEITSEVLQLVDREICVENIVFPLIKMDDSLFVAFFDPFDHKAYEKLSETTGLNIEICLSKASEIINAINLYYKLTEEIKNVIHEATTTTLRTIPIETEPKVTEVDTPIIKMVNLIIQQAILERATDIHIDPEDEYMSIKYRIDGVLFEFQRLIKNLHSPIVSRIKIISKMDIDEKRLPQDGFSNFKIGNLTYNLRIATYPTVKGEKVVIRILPETTVYHLNELGLIGDNLEKIYSLIKKNTGLILVTGPTGSGKTTTLYSMIEEISKSGKNILTIEEPVEIKIKNVNQSETLPEKNWTFDVALRAMLRMDPDVIMVGEIRDKPSATISVQSALTGHLVLSTLHTQSAISSIIRLLDMGIESYLLSSSLVGVINQRLVRLVCPYCRVKYMPDEKLFSILKIKKREYEKGKGCNYCLNTGYRGRTGIFEILLLNEDICREIFKNPELIE